MNAPWTCLALTLLAAAAAPAAPPSTAWKELVPPDEPARFQTYLQDVKDLQDRNAAKGDGTIRRGFHAKEHAGVKAHLVVPAEVPAAARYGIFAKPGTYEARVRMSNGLGVIQSDKVPDVRGFAVKVLGVPGPTLLDDPDQGVVQDFVTINHTWLPIRDIEQLIALVRATAHPATLVLKLPRILGVSGAGRALRFAATQLRRKTISLLAEDYYTVIPIKLGPYAAKVQFRHRAEIDDQDAQGPDYLREDLAKRLAAGEQRFDVCVQFYVDDQATPIEDGSVEWDEARSPFVKVAELVLEKQDPSSAEGKSLSAAVDALQFNPWHCHPDHRPLGSLMRARRTLYPASAAYRLQAGH